MSTNFITVFYKESAKKGSKRAMLSPSISTLKRQIKKLFQLDKEIRALYTSDGRLITSMDEILPKMTIYASSNIPDDEFSNEFIENEFAEKPKPKTVSLFAAPGSIMASQNQKTGTPKNKAHFSQLPSSRNTPQVSCQSPLSKETPQSGLRSPSPRSTPLVGSQLSSPRKSSPMNSQINSPKSTSQLRISSRPQTPTESSKIPVKRAPESNAVGSTPEANSEYQAWATSSNSHLVTVQAIDSPAQSMRSQLSRASSKNQIPAVREMTEEEKEELRLAEAGISKNNMMAILNKACGDEENPIFDNEVFEEAFKVLPPLMRKVMSQSEELQKMEESYIFKNVTNQIIKQIPQHTQKLDESVAEFVKSGIKAVKGVGINMHFKTLIAGPPLSGKTTFLTLATKKIYETLVSSGLYKSTFVFTMDFDDLAKSSLDDPVELYRFIIKQTIQEICTQKIEIKQFEDSLINYFIQLPTLTKITQFPKNIAQAEDFKKAAPVLMEMSKNIYDSLKKSFSLKMLLTNVMLIPNTVAKAFGFTRVMFFIDHFDSIECAAPTNETLENDIENMPLMEFAKLMIADSSYVISCHNEEVAFDNLEAISDDSIDLSTCTDVFSVIDADESEEHDDSVSFDLIINNGTTIMLRRDDLGGVPGYLAKWDVIAKLGKELSTAEHKENDSKKIREQKLILISKIRELATILFSESNDDPFGKKIKDYRTNQSL